MTRQWSRAPIQIRAWHAVLIVLAIVAVDWLSGFVAGVLTGVWQ